MIGNSAPARRSGPVRGRRRIRSRPSRARRSPAYDHAGVISATILRTPRRGPSMAAGFITLESKLICPAGETPPQDEDPDAFDAHVWICGGRGWATTQVYPAIIPCTNLLSFFSCCHADADWLTSQAVSSVSCTPQQRRQPDESSFYLVLSRWPCWSPRERLRQLQSRTSPHSMEQTRARPT